MASTRCVASVFECTARRCTFCCFVTVLFATRFTHISLLACGVLSRLLQYGVLNISHRCGRGERSSGAPRDWRDLLQGTTTTPGWLS